MPLPFRGKLKELTTKEAESASTSMADAAEKASKEPSSLEPQVLGESQYDRVTSMLMAFVMGAGIVVGWIVLIVMTNRAYAGRAPAGLEVIDVNMGTGGGSPDGTPGSTESVDVPGAEADKFASNNPEEPLSDFEEPAVQQNPATVLDAMAIENSSNPAEEVDLGPVMASGGPVASGRRASKIGSGGPGLGMGSGDGGVPPEQRWRIEFNPGQTLDEYARQLDSLQVELATPGTRTTLDYASGFSQATPRRRTGPARDDRRLYFAWQGKGRSASDIALLQKAGITVGDKPILQFYSPAVEKTLAQLETGYKGRQPGEIRVTRFTVSAQGNGYGFSVVSQETWK